MRCPLADRLRNHVLLSEAIRQIVLRPAVADPGVVPRAPLASTVTAPIFVVSSPRAGSSLFFETLARSPELFTIGGESHRLIEEIPPQ